MNKKLITTIVTVASLFLAFSFSHGASAKKVSGNITWYNGVGKKGADGKKLGHWDAATKMGFDVPKKGTKLRVTTKAKPHKVITVYKYDVAECQMLIRVQSIRTVYRFVKGHT
ncbi:hypothetical protein [Bacillus safensis FO-36b] [Bacillus safensis subsp. safensis]